MADRLHLKLVKKGSHAWNTWRAKHQEHRPNLSEAALAGANLSGADLSEANLSRATLIRAILSGANLREARLGGADLSEANLSRANLVKAALNGAILRATNLSGADLYGADLTWANLSGADLSEASLRGTDLSGADLSRAILSRVDLFRGNLRGANLSRADLHSADLREVNLYGATLTRATLRGANLSPGMPVLDAPVSIPLCCGLPPYSPQNYDLRFHGLISIRDALQNSFNVPGVKVLYGTGVNAALRTAQAMGITSYNGTPNYTMVLGTLGVHLLDMTSAYGVFADGGVRASAHAIDTVYDTQGKLVYRFVPTGQRIISPQIAYLMTNVLSDNQARTYEFGACSSLYLYSNTQVQCYAGNPGTVYPSAVKTGTSQNFADNWTIGYTTDDVMGVWAGNNDNSPMINVIGVTGAGPIWHEGMLLAEQGHSPSDFPIPPGLVRRTVTYPEGLTTTDLYIKGLSWADWGLGWPGVL